MPSWKVEDLAERSFSKVSDWPVGTSPSSGVEVLLIFNNIEGEGNEEEEIAKLKEQQERVTKKLELAMEKLKSKAQDS